MNLRKAGNISEHLDKNHQTDISNSHFLADRWG